MERVTVKVGGDRFDLCIGGRYTIIVGMSGMGKTKLAGAANKCFEVPGYAEISGKYKSIATAGTEHWMLVFESNADIVVIDEEALFGDIGDERARALMKQFSHHYLVLSRGGLNKVPFGVTDIYDMDWLSEHHARMVPHRWGTELLRKARNPDRFLLCEDRKSGYIAAKESYKKCGMLIDTAGGKDRITTYGITSGYIAADLCGLGSTAFDIEVLLDEWPDVQLCDVISFEAECLKSQGVLPTLPEDVISAEAFYESSLKTYLLSRYNLTYSKGNEDVVCAMITGHYSHDHQKLEGWVRSDWWVPGVPHKDTQWLLQAYHDTFDEEYTGALPLEVSSVSDDELHRNVMDILIKMHKSQQAM